MPYQIRVKFECRSPGWKELHAGQVTGYTVQIVMQNILPNISLAVSDVFDIFSNLYNFY